MRKRTSVLHYGAGVVAALVTLLYSIPVGILLVSLFVILEVWDAVKGRDSWWDLQEFLLAYYAICVLVLLMGLLALLFGTPICEVCQ